jgi:hypothetical protein
VNIQLRQWQDGRWTSDEKPLVAAELVLYFGASASLRAPTCLEELRGFYPNAQLVGCSTSGEIFAEEAGDDRVVAAALEFQYGTSVRTALHHIGAAGDSEAIGLALGAELRAPTLRCVFILSDGTTTNGSALVRGLRGALGNHVVITGGLAGDGDRFTTTLVGADGPPTPGNVVGVGFYGEAIQVGHGSVGGWEAFGPTRSITRSRDNVLYELDGEPALALYKKSLGGEDAVLPGGALRFPLSILRSGQAEAELVRTVLSVDEETQSMTFAGDMPEGAATRLMRGSQVRLVTGAGDAARQARLEAGSSLAILVSCIGRKLLMGERVSDEVEAVTDVLGGSTFTLGFYSYGELSPHSATGMCELHNQTMTITTLSERAAEALQYP